MDGDFVTRAIQAIKSGAPRSEILEGVDNIKITSECIYCGRSKSDKPHLGIMIAPADNNKITGGIRCFRCNTKKSLRSFLFDLHESLAYYGISKDDIYKNVVVVEVDDNKFNLDFSAILKNNFVEQAQFYNQIKNKYNTERELRREIFFNLNCFLFLKRRLNLKCKTTLYEASRVLKEIKGRGYISKDNRLVMVFDNKVRYIFDSVGPEMVPFEDTRDSELFGQDAFPFVFKSYTKMKNPTSNDDRYYLIHDSNFESEEYDIMNVYVAEGVFDCLSMKYYKNVFDMDVINTAEQNIYNVYVAMAHSEIDRFVSEYFLGVSSDRSGLPRGIKRLNFVMIPDLNMNVNKYVHSLHRFIMRHNSVIRALSKHLGTKIYYLDIFDAANCYDLNKIKDVNDIINVFNKRALRTIGLIEVF